MSARLLIWQLNNPRLFRPSSIISKGTFRTMTSAGKKMEWLVILPDQEGAIERRLKVRQEHLQRVNKDLEVESNDYWLLGGAFMSDVPKEGETPPMIGSVMIGYAESKEELLKRLKDDIYTKGDVWDWNEVQVYPFKSAIRKGL